MKTAIFLFFLSLPLIGYSQKDTIVILTVSANNTFLERDKDFVFSITFFNKSNSDLYVSPNPVISSVVGGFGDIMIQIERLDSSCYKIVDIDENPIGVKFDSYIEEIKVERSVTHKIDVRSFGFMKKGVYRIKAYYNFNYLGRKDICESRWIYFEVKNHVSLKNPSLFREISQ